MKYKIIMDLIDLKAAFEAAGIPFFLQEGCALGAGRCGDILDHDVDIDVGVTVEVTPKERRKLFQQIMAYGWYNIIDSTDFVFAFRNVKLNIWFYHLEGDYWIAYPDSTPGDKAAWPKRFYEKLHRVPMYGHDFYTPHPLEEYLAFRYGVDWKDNVVSNEMWKQTEQLVFKWKHKMKIESDPGEVNQEWLQSIAT